MSNCALGFDRWCSLAYVYSHSSPNRTSPNRTIRQIARLPWERIVPQLKLLRQTVFSRFRFHTVLWGTIWYIYMLMCLAIPFTDNSRNRLFQLQSADVVYLSVGAIDHVVFTNCPDGQLSHNCYITLLCWCLISASHRHFNCHSYRQFYVFET
jgi:hypothetical protein